MSRNPSLPTKRKRPRKSKSSPGANRRRRDRPHPGHRRARSSAWTKASYRRPDLPALKVARQSEDHGLGRRSAKDKAAGERAVRAAKLAGPQDLAQYTKGGKARWTESLTTGNASTNPKWRRKRARSPSRSRRTSSTRSRRRSRTPTNRGCRIGGFDFFPERLGRGLHMVRRRVDRFRHRRQAQQDLVEAFRQRHLPAARPENRGRQNLHPRPRRRHAPARFQQRRRGRLLRVFQ